MLLSIKIEFTMSQREVDDERWGGDFSGSYLESISTNESKLENFIHAILPKIEEAKAKVDVTTLIVLSSLHGKAEYCLQILKNRNDASARNELPRIADIEAGIKDEMTYKYDLVCFSDKVNEVFKWYETDDKKKYLAPYFPLLQSSGMGKTKLIYEYKKHVNEMKGEKKCLMILCEKSEKNWNKRRKNQDSIFDEALVVSGNVSHEEREKIIGNLNTFLEKNINEEVVMLFDEAGALLENNAFPFRCIRWWLRLKNLKKKVVAVFTGTTSKLANFFVESPISQFSRSPNIQEYYEDGKELYNPYFQLCTTGILQKKWNEVNETDKYKKSDCDFRRAVGYGRPLFVHLNWMEFEERIIAICQRMLLLTDANNGAWTPDSHFSILGTRVQFGQTHFHLASKLVSHGYALLTWFDAASEANVARICFQPDPVCAYIAMALMTEDFSVSEKIKGKAPKYWTRKASELVTGGICVPAKGDVGEVAGALYLLFCGDYLRYEENTKLTTFNVSLLMWIDLLFNRETRMDSQNSKKRKKSHLDICRISFIQVCTNHLRHPIFFLSNQQLLKEWYEAGLAYFACSQAFAFDLVAPILYGKDEDSGSLKYCPLLVQFKNRVDFSEDDKVSAFKALKDAFNKAEVKIGLGIVLLLGHENPKNMKNEMNSDKYKSKIVKEVKSWCENVCSRKGDIFTCCISVPDDDCFGISDLARSSSFGGGQRAEIYESSSIINQLAKSNISKPFTKLELSKFVRSHTNANDTKYFTNILKAFKDALS